MQSMDILCEIFVMRKITVVIYLSIYLLLVNCDPKKKDLMLFKKKTHQCVTSTNHGSIW